MRKPLSQTQKEIAKLSEFLMHVYPYEIGNGDFKQGESAVDVAIRLLKEKKIQENTEIFIQESSKLASEMADARLDCICKMMEQRIKDYKELLDKCGKSTT